MCWSAVKNALTHSLTAHAVCCCFNEVHTAQLDSGFWFGLFVLDNRPWNVEIRRHWTTIKCQKNSMDKWKRTIDRSPALTVATSLRKWCITDISQASQRQVVRNSWCCSIICCMSLKWEIMVVWFCIIISILLSILSLLVFGWIRFRDLSAEVDGSLGAADVDGCGSTVVGVGAMSNSDAAATSVELERDVKLYSLTGCWNGFISAQQLDCVAAAYNFQHFIVELWPVHSATAGFLLIVNIFLSMLL